ncbi:hypothetical protein [Arthrobacter sp. zg-Y877]|uniref:hypothetical protein n=1 Tax=Arthrobacter sp. zg-Y877 TaxID=3049074 RepID=UPI0025A32378|nr:hypothetical protein [Arthrobacter sp. zg-Y877]MDM7991361.1 hypothetical protein [Arthrobacter sp. zg-Y877]
MYLPTVLIASLALIFTVSSFWWLNARPGRLVFYSVTTFGGYINTQSLVIQIPVVVHNTGAKPRVIRELRLEGVDQPGGTFRLEAQTFHKKLGPGGEGSDFVHPFAVNGRSVITKYVRFATDNVPLLVPGESMKLVLQGLVGEGDSWVELKTLDIHVGILVNSFLTMSNNPGHWKTYTLADGREHQEAVMGLLRERRQVSAGDPS